MILKSDLSNLSYRESYRDWTFWQIWAMLVFSMMFCMFMKVAFKSYGSTIYDDDTFLTNIAKVGFFSAACSRFGWALLQEIIGFKTVYLIILVIQITLAFSMTSVSDNPIIYMIYVAASWSCEGGQ